jgi:endonuclease YncB( thermonuclease family)
VVGRMRRAPIACLLALTALAAAAPVAEAARRGPCLERGKGPRCTFWNARVTFVADGDTLRADVAGDGTRAERTIRMTGYNAMELTRYSSNPSRRRGACHGIAATALVDRLVKRSHRRIRLSAQHASSRTGSRLRRTVWVRSKGRWRDLGRVVMARGLALWLPSGSEFAHNREYHLLAERAAAAGRGLYDPASCRPGPDQDVPIGLSANWDADGNDQQNLDGEWIEVRNGGARPLPLGGWRVRDSWQRDTRGAAIGYALPAGTVVPAGGAVRVHVGCGADGGSSLFWCLRESAFENVTGGPRNMGDGAYLLDPDGDLRAAMLYPCLTGCADPLRGSVRLDVQPRRDEAIDITNVGGAAIDLSGHTVKLHARGRRNAYVFGYPFGAGSVLAPGETLSVRPDSGPDSRLVRHLGRGPHVFSDGGGVVSLRTLTDIVTACTAWGSERCP